MCLISLDFTMLWDEKENDYVGKGYKYIEYSRGEFWPAKDGYKYSLNTWMKSNQYKGSSLFVEKEGIQYSRGFHIFLNLDDAAYYRSKLMTMYDKPKLHPVLYKDVRAFGQQEIYGKHNYRVGYHRGPCVIAHEMKILDPIPFPWETENVPNNL